MIRFIALCVAAGVLGIGYWSLTNVVFGTDEPWDTMGYFLTYPVAVVISAGLGTLSRGSGTAKAGLFGALFIFAQLPGMIRAAAGAPMELLGLGVIFLAALSLPAVLASIVGAATSRRRLVSASAA